MENQPHEWDGQTWICNVCGHKMSDALTIEQWKTQVLAETARQARQARRAKQAGQTE